MIDTNEEDWLYRWDQDPEEPPQPGPFLLLSEASEAKPREKRDERKAVREPWIQPHLKPATLRIPVQRARQVQLLCFDIVVLTNKWIIVNTSN